MEIIGLDKRMQVKIIKDNESYKVTIKEGFFTLEIEITETFQNSIIGSLKYLKIDDKVEIKGDNENVKYMFNYLSSSKVVTDEFSILNKIKI